MPVQHSSTLEQSPDGIWRTVNNNGYSPAESAAIARQRAGNARNIGRIKIGTLATAGLVSGGAAGLFGGAGAAGGGSLAPIAGGAPWSVAPLAGTAASVGAGAGAGAGGMAAAGVPWMRIGELGAGLFSNWRGNAAQSKANDQEFAYRSQADERAFQMQSQMETQRQKEWAAQQQMLQQQFAAQQEQERLDRLEAEAERNRQWGLSDRNEAAKVPYRQAGQIALRDLLAGLR